MQLLLSLRKGLLQLVNEPVYPINSQSNTYLYLSIFSKGFSRIQNTFKLKHVKLKFFSEKKRVTEKCVKPFFFLFLRLRNENSKILRIQILSFKRKMKLDYNKKGLTHLTDHSIRIYLLMQGEVVSGVKISCCQGM